MRPIQLKLAGLHSYRQMQEVDFEQLCEAGLFGIFGPTGSGKSTILDAITLALYGQVVRLGGGTHPKDVLNQLEQRVYVSFTFEIGTAIERKRYTIEREFGIDKKGNRRQPEVRLIECGMQSDETDVVLESKASAATSAIEELIGLTLLDFTRAVVLPQGQFSKFLTLKGSERNEMLQRMFGLQIYGEKLNDRVRGAHEQIKAELHRLQIELAQLGDVGPESLDTAKNTLEAVEQQEQTYSLEKQTMAAQMRELEQLNQWQVERVKVIRRMEQLQVEQTAVDGLEIKVKELEASVQIWPLLKKLREVEHEWSKTELALQRQRGDQESATRDHEAAEQQYQAAHAQIRIEEPLLLEQKSRLTQAMDWESELAGLRIELTTNEQELVSLASQLGQVNDQLTQHCVQMEVWDRELAQISEKLHQATVSPETRKRMNELRDAKRNWERETVKQSDLEKDLVTILQERQSLTVVVEQMESTWKQAVNRHEHGQKQLAELEAKPIASDQELDQTREALAQVKALGKEWRELLTLESVWEAKWTAWELAWQESESQTTSMETAWRTQDERLSLLQRKQEGTKSTWQEWQQIHMARVLRASLTAEEECPVCGCAHHPFHNGAQADEHDEHEQEAKELSAQVQTVEAEVRDAEQQTKRALEVLQTAKLERAALQQRKETLLEEKIQKEQRLANIKAECHELGEVWHVTDFSELLKRFKDTENTLCTKTEEREQHKHACEQQQQELNRLREHVLEQKNSCERQSFLQEQCIQRQSDQQARLDEQQTLVTRMETELQQLCGELPIEMIEEEWAKQEELDQQQEQLQQERAKREELITQVKPALEMNQQKRTELALREAAMRERGLEKKNVWQQKHQMWLERTGGEPAGNRLAQIGEKLEALRKSADESEEKWKASAQKRQQVQEQLVKTTEGYALLTRQQSESLKATEDALQQSGLETVGRLEQLFAEREQIAALKERISSYQTILSGLRYDEQRLAQALAGRLIAPEEYVSKKRAWDELEQLFQTVKDKVAVARQALSRIEGNHEKWVILQADVTEKTDEQSRLEELKKLFEGKAFVQFVAEEKLSSIARDATYHLKQMTKNRYALEIGDEGEFVLRDEGAGGMRRSVGTLSGGETFLTSLSLALALSVEIQMRGGRLEFFFLDEGFGTLDPELLEVVLDALDRLRMNDFTIGVISHVPEMRVRMPRRLIITPAEPLGTGSRIDLEME